MSTGLLIKPLHYMVQFWNETANEAVSGMSHTIHAEALIPKEFNTNFNLVDPNNSFSSNSSHSYSIHIQAIANNTVFNSPIWRSQPLAIDRGIGHSVIGSTFTIE
jgi:hypothetical protein